MRPLLLAAFLLAVPAPALGARAVVVAGTAHFAASAGERNELAITIADGSVRLSDPGAPVTPDVGCTPVDEHTVTCAATAAEARLGDLGDRARCGASCVLHGGQGDDLLAGGRQFGGPGSDDLGSREMRGGSGDDHLRAIGRHRAQARCGPGDDVVYPSPTTTLERDCERFGETGWGRSTIRARGERLRLGIRTINGCAVSLRLERQRRIARVARELTPVAFALPAEGPAVLYGRSACAGDGPLRRLFAVAGR